MEDRDLKIGSAPAPHRLAVVLSLVLLGLAVSAFAQTERQAPTEPRGSGGQQDSLLDTQSDPQSSNPDSDNAAPTALSANRIIEILQRQPEVLVYVKQMARQNPVDPRPNETESQEITDDDLFQRIEQDDDFRLLVTSELKNRGFLTPEDIKPTVAETAGLSREPRIPSAKRPAGKVQSESPPPAEDPNQPPTTVRPNPYPDLPSLQDLYRQIRSGKGALKRFGADIFRNGTGNLEKLPMDLPAGPDYVLGPGDGVNINIWGSISRTILRTVDREGRLALPDAAAVVVAGQTIVQAQDLIARALATQYHNARVDLSLTRLRSIRVYVSGDVERPGAYDISSLSTPLNALYMAGGPTARGSLRAVRHFRDGKLIREVDLYDLLLHGVLSGIERLEPGDTILVPPAGNLVSVAGMVRRPAIYELRGERELTDVLQLAGGVLVSATLRQISVERIEPHQRRLMLNVDLPATGDPATLSGAIGGFPVLDGDYITIVPILPYSDQTVYLNGHVFRPGKYPYQPGMQITDLIHSYADLLPEPADYAELIRLMLPDHHPEATEFNLADILAGNISLALQPFDTVRIFGRYEIDAPKVSIFGEVLRPGEYPLARGMKATDLVRLAGGFRRSAFTERADIADYRVNSTEVVTELKTIDMAQALAGDAAADAVLKPGNIVTIRRLPGWDDIGITVTVHGEVQYPGSYGTENGERLSTLLKRAGGFRTKAYPQGAVLERGQVREQEEATRLKLIQSIEATGADLKMSATASGQDQAAMLQAMTQQRQQIVSALRSQPASGRLVIRISPDIESWQNTSADIELRAGDVITIPRNPSFVLVSGQVYNPTALTYAPGKNADWYLQQAGGATHLANKKDIYIIRANGSVISPGSLGSGLWKGNVLDAKLHPGDTVVVPEKIIGGSSVWKAILDAAQLASNVAIAARVASSF